MNSIDSPSRSPLHALLVTIILGLLVSACARERARDARSAAPTADSAGPVRLRDAYGEEVTLPHPARRIVSLAPNLTETVAAIGATDLLVGRTAYCDYPPEVLKVPVIADLQTIRYEAVLQRKPDLVLMSWAGNIGSNYDKLKQLGLRPYLLGAANLHGVINAIDTIGLLVGRGAQARAVSNRLRAEVDSIGALAAAAPRVSVFVVIDKAPLMTVSKGFLNDLIDAAGGTNIAAGAITAYPLYNREELLRRDPDVILIPWTSTDIVPEMLRTYPEWQRLRAVREKRIYAMPRDILFRPGPRLGQGLRSIFEALHGADPDSLFRRYSGS